MCVQAGSLLIVDTSGFHLRGYEQSGKQRALLGRPTQETLHRGKTARVGAGIAMRPLGLCAIGDYEQC